jgi:hypothetical protein
MSESQPPSERPPIDLSNEAVQRAQARREALTQRSGARNILIGIGLAIAAVFAIAMFFGSGDHAPPPMPTGPSGAAPAARTSPSSAGYEAPLTPPPPPSGNFSDVPFVDPRTGPQSGYDIEAAEASKASGLPGAAVLAGEEPHLAAERIFAKSGIRLIRLTETSRAGRVSCDAAPDDEVRRYASLVENELAVYPQKFLSEAGVQFVALCRDLIDAGLRRSATAIVTSRTLVIDTAEYRDEAYFRATFHRAFFRLLDEVGPADPEWSALNAPARGYTGGVQNPNDPVTAVASGGAGFVTETARESAEIDKAETFRAMLLDNRAVERLAASDPVVNAKVRLMQKRLLARSNAFDSAFWFAAH